MLEHDISTICSGSGDRETKMAAMHLLPNREPSKSAMKGRGEALKQMNMKIVIPFSTYDKHRTARLLSWLLILGFTRETYGKDVHLVLAHTRRSSTDGLKHLAKAAFASVEEFVPEDENESGWPEACNFLFIRTAEFLSKNDGPFLWLEPDAVPLCVGFLGKLSEAYAQAPHGSIMGQVSQISDPNDARKIYPFLHTGVAIYPDATSILPYVQIEGFPWDCQISEAIKDKMYHSALIQDVKICPNFYFSSAIRHISTEACVFHHNKDGSLIELLSRKHMRCPEKVHDPLDRKVKIQTIEVMRMRAMKSPAIAGEASIR